MTDKLINEEKQIERYGRTLKELEAEYGHMTPDELLQQAWAWTGDVLHHNMIVGEEERVRHAGEIVRWLIGTARKFSKNT